MSVMDRISRNLARTAKWGQTWSDRLQSLLSLIKPSGGPEPEAAAG